MVQQLQPIIDYLNNNQGVLALAIFLVPALMGTIYWLIRRIYRQAQLRRPAGEINSLAVVSDPNKLTPLLYGEENVTVGLTNSAVPYQDRDPNRKIQEELQRMLNLHRCILIRGRSGSGKTREAAVLASAKMAEGYRVVWVKEGWLDVPRQPLSELAGSRRVIILIDDLNKLFGAGRTSTPAQSEKSMLGILSYHDRLAAVLDWFEGIYGESDVRVIATARDDAGEWDKLDFKKPDRLWSRFVLYDLPLATPEAIAECLSHACHLANVSVKEDETILMARASDRTFRTVVANVRRTAQQGYGATLTTDSFTPHAERSWRDDYVLACRKHPTTQYVYEAMLILRQLNIPLYRWLVDLIARWSAGGNFVQRIHRRLQIKRAMSYLTRPGGSLIVDAGDTIRPSDGQIEASGLELSWRSYADDITDLVLKQHRPRKQRLVSDLFNLAHALQQTNRNDLAKQVYRDVIRLDPTNKVALNNLGYSLNKTGQNEESEAAYREAIRLDPSFSPAHNNLGHVLLTTGRNVEAEAAYREAIRLDPNLSPAHNNLGHLLLTTGRNMEAEAAFHEAIRLDPTNAAACSNLGHVLSTTGRNVEAEVAFCEAIRLEPTNAAAYSNLGHVLSIIGRSAEAEAAFREAIRLEPTNAATHLNLGNLLWEAKCTDEAEAVIREAIRLDPTDPTVYKTLGNLLWKARRMGEAEAAFREAIRLDPIDARVHFSLGNLLWEAKCTDEAEVAICEAIRLDPTVPVVHKTLGNLMWKAKRMEEAEAAFREAIRLFPAYASAHNDLGNLLSDLGRNEEAEAAYLEAIRLDPANAKAHNNLGLLLRDLNRNDEAEAAFREVIQLDPANALAHRNLGRLLRRQDRNAEAMMAFSAYTNLRPEDPNGLMALACLHKQAGDLPASAEMATRAREHFSVDDHYNLACLESICDNIDAAIDHLREAAKRSDFDPEWARKDWDLEWIRHDPRFEEVLATATQ